MTREDNGFNLLRMGAASCVLYSHCFALSTGRDSDQPFAHALWGTNLGNLAVDVFFVVSGFLVCGSLLARQDLRTFWRARALRVYPGLLVSLALTLLAALLALHAATRVEFLSRKATWMFVVKNSLLFFGTQTELPIVLDGLPKAGVANGSLWTLPLEVRLYLALGLMWWAARHVRARWAAATFERALLLVAVTAMLVYAFAGDPSQAGLRFTAYFAAGAALQAHARRIPWRLGLFVGAALAVVLALASGRMACFHAVHALTLPYLVLYLAQARLPVYRAYNRLGDYSYGMYIYAFPVTQFVLLARPGLSTDALFPLTMGITLVLAVMSWKWVEEPVLRLKSRPLGGSVPAHASTAAGRT